MPSIQLFLDKYRVLVDSMLRDGLFFEARNIIIKERYFELLRSGLSGVKAIEKLANDYRLAYKTIKNIIYD